MAHLNVTINGRNYAIACEDGQQEHLGRLADYVKARVDELVDSVGQIGDARLLLMASLLVSDELSDAYSDLEAARAALEDASQSAAAAEEEGTTVLIEQMAARIEAIAEQLEAT
ncbi:MAG: cell division protein ZapA [Alphaproteobacteria bacterium]